MALMQSHRITTWFDSCIEILRLIPRLSSCIDSASMLKSFYRLRYMYGDAEQERPHLAVTNVLIMEWFKQCGVHTASIMIPKSLIPLTTAMEGFAVGANASNVGSVLALMSVRFWQHL